jgi:hypothetical protein
LNPKVNRRQRPIASRRTDMACGQVITATTVNEPPTNPRITRYVCHTHDKRAGDSGSQTGTKDAYREVLGPFSEIRRMNRYAPVCLAGTVRSQSFSLSQRFDPHSSLWLCFVPHPLVGFLPQELPSPSVTPLGNVTSLCHRSPLVRLVSTRMQTVAQRARSSDSRRSDAMSDTPRKHGADALLATSQPDSYALNTSKPALNPISTRKRAEPSLIRPAAHQNKPIQKHQNGDHESTRTP